MNVTERISDIICEANNSGEAWYYHIEALTGNKSGVSTADLNEYVAEFIGLDTAELDYISCEDNHDSLARSLLAYIRTDMKKKGMITNPKKGVWFLTANAPSADTAKDLGKKESIKRANRKRKSKDIRMEVVNTFRSFNNNTKATLKSAGVNKDTIVNLVAAHHCSVSEAYHIFLNNS